jgi:hypothetical protein
MDMTGKQKSLSEILNLFDKAESAKFDQKRKANNQKLVDILQKLVNENPSQRFSQILQNFGFIKPNRPANSDLRIDWQNEFYSEPQDIITRVEERVKDIEAQRVTTET